MRTLKNFIVWWDWFLSRNLIIFVIFFVGGLFCLVTYVVSPVFVASPFLNKTYSPVFIQIYEMRLIIGIIGVILLCSIFSCFFIIENYRLVLDNIKNMIVLNKIPSEKTGKILMLIQKTTETKNGSELGQWIENWEIYLLLKKDLEDLEKKLNKLPNELRDRIQKTQEQIKELELKL
jgi:hypothetical protein